MKEIGIWQHQFDEIFRKLPPHKRKLPDPQYRVGQLSMQIGDELIVFVDRHLVCGELKPQFMPVLDLEVDEAVRKEMQTNY